MMLVIIFEGGVHSLYVVSNQIIGDRCPQSPVSAPIRANSLTFRHRARYIFKPRAIETSELIQRITNNKSVD